MSRLRDLAAIGDDETVFTSMISLKDTAGNPRVLMEDHLSEDDFAPEPTAINLVNILIFRMFMHGISDVVIHPDRIEASKMAWPYLPDHPMNAPELCEAAIRRLKVVCSMNPRGSPVEQVGHAKFRALDRHWEINVSVGAMNSSARVHASCIE